jgi:hypothetical protein
MYPITVLISSSPLSNPNINSAEVIDTLWAHSMLEDGLEHISVSRTDDSIDLVLFVNSGTARSAFETAMRIFNRVLTFSPFAADWKITSSEVESSHIRITPLNPGDP